MKAFDKLAERLRRRGGAAEGSGEAGTPSEVALQPAGVGAAAGSGGDLVVLPAAEPPVDLVVQPSVEPPVDPREEAALWERLRSDPNDVEAFPKLAEMVRYRAAEGHDEGNRQRAADDAVWALAEELAHNSRAWFPLVELGRLSVHDDRENALRRFSTASDRDPSGQALATGLAVLREAGLPSDALGLGMAHWRPREHDLEAGRHLVLAAIEARRIGDARRHLEALGAHPDAGRVAALQAELEGLITQLEAERASGGPMTDPAGISVRGPLSGPIDLRGVQLPKS